VNIWMVLGAVTATIAVVVPVAAIALVSVASLREEAAQTLGRKAPGAMQRVARQVVGYHGKKAVVAPVRRRPRPAARVTRQGIPEVRFGHASRTLPDPGQFSASGQPQPGAERAEYREPAGV
jgi:hypothetical protein